MILKAESGFSGATPNSARARWYIDVYDFRVSRKGALRMAAFYCRQYHTMVKESQATMCTRDWGRTLRTYVLQRLATTQPVGGGDWPKEFPALALNGKLDGKAYS